VRVSDDRADHGVEPVGVDLPDQPADGRFRRAPPVGPEHYGHLDRQVGDPFGDRDERPRPGRDRADRGGQDHGQAVADPAALTRIDHPRQSCVQARRESDWIG
jgi:hypothetical protein